MKKLIFLLVSIFLLNSCSKKNELLGVWISVSSFNDDEKPTAKYSQEIFDFQSDSVIIVQLKNYGSGAYGKIQLKKWSYEIKDSQILIFSDKDTSSFSYTIQDSLILNDQKAEGDFKKSFVLKRLDLNLNFSNTLKGLFTYNWPEESDTICFVNDSICIGLGGNQMVKWRVFNYRGANLFIYQDGLFPSAAIWNNHPDTFNLSYHIQPKKKFSFVKSHSLVDRGALIGEWTKYPTNSKYPLPPPSLDFDPDFINLKMTIQAENLSIHFQNGTRTDHWKVTKDGSYIYFPDHLMSRDGFWKIIHASKDSLVFKTRHDRKVKWHRNS